MPIEFDANYPFLQVQPVHRSVYGEALDGFEVVERSERTDAGGLGRLPQDRRAADAPTRTAMRANTLCQTRKRRKEEPGTDT